MTILRPCEQLLIGVMSNGHIGNGKAYTTTI